MKWSPLSRRNLRQVTEHNMRVTESKKESDEYKKMLNMIGIAKRAGVLLAGAPSVTAEVRSPKSKARVNIVLMSNECSENTTKQITNVCDFHGVPLKIINVTMSDFGHAIGKKGSIGAAAVVKNKNLADAILERIAIFENTVTN